VRRCWLIASLRVSESSFGGLNSILDGTEFVRYLTLC